MPKIINDWIASNTRKPRRYTVVACNEDGEHLAEVNQATWLDVSSLIAAWTRQFELGMDAGDGLRWDENGYIQIHIERKA